MASALQQDWLTQESEADPRIAAAVADFRGTVIEIRRLSAELFTTDEGTTKRSVLLAHVDDLIGGMQARADVVGITLDQLFALINAELKRKRVGQDHQPHGDHLRTMVDENTSAYADEARLHHEIERLQKLVPAAINRRIAADRACAGYCAGWAVRGRARA